MTPEEQAKEDGFVVNPYEIVNTTGKEIDYVRLVKQFGLNIIPQEQIDRLEYAYAEWKSSQELRRITC